jgi:MerR family transcriptional regulator, repressor of the yfmOP operon
MSLQTVSTEAGTVQSDLEPFLLIGEAAARTGLTQRTIRYYEELGLLPPPLRTHGDFRLYSPRDVRRLEEIVRMKNLLGFSLAEVRQVIEAEEAIEQLRSEFRATDDASVRLEKLDEATRLTSGQLKLLERKMAQMQELKSELKARLARYADRRAELEVARLEEVRSGS